MSTVIGLFHTYGYLLELVVCLAAVMLLRERQERFGLRCLAILAPAILFLTIWTFIPDNVYTETIRTLVLWTVIAIGAYACWILSRTEALFYATAACTIQHISYRAARLAQNMIYGHLPAPWVWDDLYPFLFAVVFGLCYYVFARRLQRQNPVQITGRKILILLVGSQLCMNLFVNIVNAYSTDQGQVMGSAVFTFYSLFDLVTTIMLLLLMCEVIEHSGAERDNAALQQMMYQQRQQLELSKEQVDLINIKCHDIRKQLRTLGSHVPQEELDELNNAINIYGAIAKTGNDALDVLLAERSIVCQGRGIELDYMIDGGRLGFLRPGEVYSLFGNALDNAIEAVTALDEDHRYIGLQLREESGMLVIRMENCTAEQPQFVDGLPRTTKGDERWHGYGVKSIRRIAEQHGGKVTMEVADGRFCMVVVLPVPVQFVR